MEKVYDTTRISNLANDPKQFCSFFCEYIKRDDISIDIALDVLRNLPSIIIDFQFRLKLSITIHSKNVLMS